jgi:hypothetical protein
MCRCRGTLSRQFLQIWHVYSFCRKIKSRSTLSHSYNIRNYCNALATWEIYMEWYWEVYWNIWRYCILHKSKGLPSKLHILCRACDAKQFGYTSGPARNRMYNVNVGFAYTMEFGNGENSAKFLCSHGPTFITNVWNLQQDATVLLMCVTINAV